MAKRGGKATRKKKRATKRVAATTQKKTKRKLSQTPEARRARARRAEVAAAKAALQKKRARAAKKAARTRKRRREELESIELGEAERRAEDRAASARRAEGDEHQLLVDVLHEMREVAARIVAMSLDITEAEVGARIPWIVVGRFTPAEDCYYSDLAEILATWRDDLVLEAKIHPQRLSMIRIVYADPNAKRGESDSIVSSMGPWEAVISEIAHELDPSDEDSLAARYKETMVPSFYVYFSTSLASEFEIPL